MCFLIFIIYTYSNICSTWFHKCSPHCIKRIPAHGPAFVEDSVFYATFPWLSANIACTGFAAKQSEASGRPMEPELFVLFSHCAVLSKEWTGTGHQDVLSGLLRATSNN